MLVFSFQGFSKNMHLFGMDEWKKLKTRKGCYWSRLGVNEMKGRRTQYEIYWEILIFCKTQRSFTSIIQQCNLNSKIGQEYLNFLTQKKYLSVERHEERSSFLTSDTAQEFLSLFSQLYRKLFETSPGIKYQFSK